MSLINQMLQDLDARRAAHGVGANLPNDVRPLPAQKRSRLPIILAGVALIALAGGLGLYQWEMRREAVLPVPPVVLAPIPAASPAPEPEKVVLPERPKADNAPPVASPLQEMEGSLRMADFLKLPDDRKEEVKPVSTAPVKPVPVEKKADERSKTELVERPPPAAPVAIASAPAKSLKTAVIEKTDPAGSPRERAENEYRKAIISVNQGRVAESMDSLRNALRQDGFHVASRQLLVKLLLEAKQPDEAVQVLQDGLQAQPAQLGWAMSLARLQVDRGDLAGAWQTLNYSQPAAGNNADYQGFSAHVLQRLGRNKDAAERYQAAARLSPGDGRWWLGLGLSWEAEGRSGEAREAFARAKQSGNLSTELMAMIEQKLR